ncbi:VOC family protein [Blastococcus sp. SYSU D00820]
MSSSPAPSPATAGLGSAPGQVERIVVAVPDPEATAQFLATGLHMQIEEQDGHLLAVCEGEYHSGRGQGAIELLPGRELAVQRLVFAVPDELELGELERLPGSSRRTDGAVEITEPGGTTLSFEHVSGLKVAVPAASALRPRRMGHVNLKSPRPPESVDFFTQVIGLRLSEYIGQDLFWMRTDTEHHNVALRPGAGGTVHHLGFEVAGWHAYQPMMDHLDAHGLKIEYGPGRHRPGRSLFVYVCDPSSGLRIELFADMVHIVDPHQPPIGWQPEDRLKTTLNTWGPTPPASFLA